MSELPAEAAIAYRSYTELCHIHQRIHFYRNQFLQNKEALFLHNPAQALQRQTVLFHHDISHLLELIPMTDNIHFTQLWLLYLAFRFNELLQENGDPFPGIEFQLFRRLQAISTTHS